MPRTVFPPPHIVHLLFKAVRQEGRSPGGSALLRLYLLIALEQAAWSWQGWHMVRWEFTQGRRRKMLRHQISWGERLFKMFSWHHQPTVLFLSTNPCFSACWVIITRITFLQHVSFYWSVPILELLMAFLLLTFTILDTFKLFVQ